MLCYTVCQAEKFGHLAMYETEDVEYRRDAETFLPEYVKERLKAHSQMAAQQGNQQENASVQHDQTTC